MRKPFMFMAVAVFLWCACHSAQAQQYDGEVSGWLSGVTHKYSGEFSDDLWGAGGMISIQYAPIHELGIEARFGLGDIRWKITPADLAAHPEYFGQGAEIGGTYPGMLTTIEPENESRLTTIDLLLNYTIVDNLAAVPFISAGVGMVDFAPSNSEEHDALPNLAAQVYSPTAVSIPLGGGVRIPFSYRAGLVLRGEYRFVFSQFLDDVNFSGENDGVTSVSVGFSYRFTNPPRVQVVLPPHHHRHHHDHCPCAADPDHALKDCPCHEELDEPADTVKAKQDSSATSSAATTQPNADTNKPVTPAPPDSTTAQPKPLSITPCPPGTARLCVEANMRVCVDTTFKPGAERIRWEDAFVFDPTDPAHQRTLRQAGAESPCYSMVVRQTGSTYYLCKDCCFQRQPLGDGMIYVVIEQGQMAKGTGTFAPVDFPDCETVVRQGR